MHRAHLICLKEETVSADRNFSHSFGSFFEDMEERSFPLRERFKGSRDLKKERVDFNERREEGPAVGEF